MDKRKVTIPLLLITLSLILVTCGGDDNPTNIPGTATGSIELRSYTSGPDPDDYDTDGYTVRVEQNASQSVDPNDTIMIDGLEKGNYDITLEGISSTCMAEGENPKSVTIVPQDTTVVTFNINCKEVLKDQIVFSSDRDGQIDLYVMNTNGTDVERLTDSPGSEWNPAISPDSAQVAYSYNGNIWIMNADGTNPVQLTNSGGDFELSWSPDGQKIAFTSWRDEDPEIYSMNRDGSNQQNLTNTPAAVDRYPSWSPDSGHIAFMSNRTDTFRVYTIKPYGTDLQILSGSSTDGYADWSPDGSKLVFLSDESGNINLHIMDADGGNRRQLTTYPSNVLDSRATPMWLGNSTEIIYVSDQDGDYEIYKINADGTGTPTKLTDNSHLDILELEIRSL